MRALESWRIAVGAGIAGGLLAGCAVDDERAAMEAAWAHFCLRTTRWGKTVPRKIGFRA